MTSSEIRPTPCLCIWSPLRLVMFALFGEVGVASRNPRKRVSEGAPTFAQLNQLDAFVIVLLVSHVVKESLAVAYT
jgi:hypothetical protein